MSSIIYQQTLPLGQENQFTMDNTVRGPFTFQINPTCFYPDECLLNFLLTIGATALNYNYLNGNLFHCINRITLRDANGTVLVNINDCDKYCASVCPISLPIDHVRNDNSYCSFIGIRGSYLTTAAAELEQKCYLTSACSRNIFISGPLSSNYDTASTTANGSQISTDISIYGLRYMFVGDTINRINGLNVSIRMKELVNTFFSYSGIVYSPNNLFVDIWFNPVNKFAFASTSFTNPLASSTNVASCTIKNISFSIASESNKSIIDSTIKKVMNNEITFNVLYPTVSVQFFNGQFVNYILRPDNSYGKRLMFITTSFFDATNGGILNYSATHNNTNYNLTKLNTTLNGKNLNYNGTLDITNADDWRFCMGKLSRKSCVETSAIYRRIFWVFVDTFCDENIPICMLNHQEPQGLPLTENPYTYQVSAEVDTSKPSNTFFWVSAVVAQREVALTNEGIKWI